ncbi:MAG: Uma2 family endonuclease [Caulobacteraceae bacterium]|nr:Uma2 family endonuclease [Caulobacteraceae bacterium]
MTSLSGSHGVEEGARRFLFDFEAYERMSDAGIFGDRRGRVELIEGVVVDRAPAGMDHARVNSDLLARLHAAVANEGLAGIDVITNGTLRIDALNAPEPDVFVARPPADGRYYLAMDALLVVEVSVSTRDTDRSVKFPLYARAAIPEFWIVEPETCVVRLYREPRPDGTWARETTVTDGIVSPLFAPGIRIALSDIFRSA